jgi:hypothetical protein
MNDFEVFYDDFMAEVRRISRGEVLEEEHEGRPPEFLENSFTECFLGYLDDKGVASGSTVCHFAAKPTKGQIKINAWASEEDEGLITLCITVYSDSLRERRIANSDVDQSLKQVVRAFQMAVSGYYKEMEPSREACDMLKYLFDNRTSIVNVDFVLLTNGILPPDAKPPKVKEGPYSYRFDCWDLTRLYKIVGSTRPYECNTINLEEQFGKGIPCLSIPSGAADHRVFLAVIPGVILSDLYEEYGQKLLDLNVRSFLQARGKVNKGIRETLCSSPSRFLAYNNGISATVESMEISEQSGQQIIRSMTGFQVVNGGQTMASIHRATKIDKADISTVFVQAKITQVELEKTPDLAPLISRYANSQNKVSDADFTSNDPVHIELQWLSEKIWAPGEQTRWFYERTRGQYQVEKGKKSPAAARKFDQEHPASQRFNKTDMAKFMQSWNMNPHMVSLGAQKNFVKFMDDLAADKGRDWRPDDEFFRQLIAKAIIFKAADSVARKAKVVSYKANVVTYMMALLSQKCLGRLDLRKVWETQRAPASVIETFESWVIRIHEAIVSTANGRNITEWCKKPECWDAIRQLPLDPSSKLRSELESSQPVSTVGDPRFNKKAGISSEARENLARTMLLDDAKWFEIARWGRKTKKLQDWQCEIAITLAGYAQGNWEKVPSPKQAAQAVRMLNIAIEEGMPEMASKG